MEAQPVKESNLIRALGVVLVVLGGMALVGLVVPQIRPLLWAAALLGGAALTYGAYRRDERRWGLLIPAYGMLGLGGLIALWEISNGLRMPHDTVNGLMASFVFAGMGFPFIYLYARKIIPWWGALPGIGAGMLAALALLIAIGPALPALMVAAGIYLILRSARSRPAAASRQPIAVPQAAAQPLTGPAADRPVPTK